MYILQYLKQSCKISCSRLSFSWVKIQIHLTLLNRCDSINSNEGDLSLNWDRPSPHSCCLGMCKTVIKNIKILQKSACALQNVRAIMSVWNRRFAIFRDIQKEVLNDTTSRGKKNKQEAKARSAHFQAVLEDTLRCCASILPRIHGDVYGIFYLRANQHV